METIITSLEQVPAGLTLLFKKVDELTAKVNSQSNQQPAAPAPADQLRTRKETAQKLRVTLATLENKGFEPTRLTGGHSAFFIECTRMYEEFDDDYIPS